MEQFNVCYMKKSVSFINTFILVYCIFSPYHWFIVFAFWWHPKYKFNTYFKALDVWTEYTLWVGRYPEFRGSRQNTYNIFWDTVTGIVCDINETNEKITRFCSEEQMKAKFVHRTMCSIESAVAILNQNHVVKR